MQVTGITTSKTWLTIAKALALVFLLSLIGCKSVDTLIQELKDENPEVRMAAARALGKKKDARAVEPLIAAMKDEDSRICDEASEALAKIGQPAVEPLIAVLKEAVNNIREHGNLTRVDYQVRDAAAKALANIGKPAVEPLIAALKDKDDGGYSVRYIAREALASIGKPAVAPLIAALRDADEGVRRYVAEALGEIQDPRAIEPLIAALKDKEDGVRQAATSALGKIQDPRAIEPLIAALKDKEDGVRQAATSALGKIQDPRVVDPLIAALKDTYILVRKNAAEALGEIKDPRAIEPLIAVMKMDNEQAEVRRKAVGALIKFGEPAVEPLLETLKEAHYVIREHQGGGVINNQGATGWMPIRAPENDIGQLVAWALGEIKDPRAIGPMIAMLDEYLDPTMQHLVHGALVNIGRPAIEPLLAALNGEYSHDSNFVRVLEDLKDPPVETFIAALKVPRTRKTAVSMLIRIGKPAVEPLIAILKDADEGTRRYAAQALDWIKAPRADEALMAAFRDKDLAIIAGADRFFIRRGEPGSEDLLCQALEKFDNNDLASDFLHSDNYKLRSAAQEWYRAKGFRSSSFNLDSGLQRALRWGSDRK